MKTGWESASIGDTCDVVNGGTPKTGVAEYWGGPHRWITPAEMGKRPTPYIDQTDRTITDQGLQNSSARPLPPYSVILSSRAPIGHLVINTEPMATNQGCKGLVPRSRIDHKFLYYYLGSIVDLLNDLGTGATFKELSGGKLKEVQVPLPPLPEQRRIVAILDEAFEGIATAKANAEKNLLNAREVFEGHLAAVFSARNEGWTDRPLHALCRRITVGHVGSMANQYKPVGIPFLRSQNIRPFSVSMENLVFIDEEFHATLAKSSLQAGDVAIVRTGYPGTAAVIPDTLGVANCSDLVIVRPGPEVDAYFLTAFFNSSFGKAMVSGKVVGAAQKHFNIGAAKDVVLHLPPMREQRSIIAAAGELRDETDRLEGLYARKLAALDELKKSLLHEAFSGAL
jgi:type I restriction enzyme, S subunit